MFRRKTHQLVLGSFGPPFLRIPVRLNVAELTSHMHITGTTKSGKSRLLAQIALSLIEQGEGVTLLDPHGDAAHLVMGHLVARGVFDDPEAYERITYLDLPAAARVGRYMPFNILMQPFDTPTTAGLVLEALRRAWPALENGVAPAFENAVLAGVSVLRHHRLPIIFLHDLLADAAWRALLLKDVTDQAVRSFFTRLDKWGSREQAQYLESTLRRAFLLNFNPVLRYSLGQTENRLGSFRDRMDEGRSLIVNLALPDPDARRLMGCLLTVLMEQGALARADVAPEQRGRNHTLILDEFGELASQSGTAMQHILEQCRKFGLGLVLANQTGEQLTERMKSAVQNVGTSIVFRLGRADAEEAARQIGTTDPFMVKHQGEEHVAHPLYASLAEQWEGWTAGIQRLSPRTAFLRRADGRVAHIQTPDLPDALVDRETVATVENRYLIDCFEVRPVIEEDLAALRPKGASTATKRRIRLPSG